MTIEELLKDTGEHDAVDDKTPSPDDLAKLAKAPATMLWTLRLMDRHNNGCSAKRWVRNFRLTLVFALGALFAMQIGGHYLGRAAIRESVRAAVIDVLREHKILSALDDQDRATGLTVASHLGGTP